MLTLLLLVPLQKTRYDYPGCLVSAHTWHDIHSFLQVGTDAAFFCDASNRPLKLGDWWHKVGTAFDLSSQDFSMLRSESVSDSISTNFLATNSLRVHVGPRILLSFDLQHLFKTCSLQDRGGFIVINRLSELGSDRVRYGHRDGARNQPSEPAPAPTPVATAVATAASIGTQQTSSDSAAALAAASTKAPTPPTNAQLRTDCEKMASCVHALRLLRLCFLACLLSTCAFCGP